MRRLLNKKGQAEEGSFATLLGIVLIAVLVIVAIFLFVTLSASFVDLETVTVTGEALTPITAGTAVSNSSVCNFAGLIVDSAVNSTNDFIDPGNFTVSGGTIANLTGLENETASPWNINYSYNFGGGACTATQVMITQFSSYPVLIGLVGTVFFLGLVVSVLVGSFGGVARRRV